MSPHIIGKSGTIIKKMREEFKCNVDIFETTNSESLIIVKGETDNIKKVKDKIEQIIKKQDFLQNEKQKLSKIKVDDDNLNKLMKNPIIKPARIDESSIDLNEGSNQLKRLKIEEKNRSIPGLNTAPKIFEKQSRVLKPIVETVMYTPTPVNEVNLQQWTSIKDGKMINNEEEIVDNIEIKKAKKKKNRKKKETTPSEVVSEELNEVLIIEEEIELFNNISISDDEDVFVDCESNDEILTEKDDFKITKKSRKNKKR